MVGRLADAWNSFWYGKEDVWMRKRDIVLAAADKAGRHPSDIEITTTIERPLPTTDAESEKMLADLAHIHALGVDHFVMDFGHPQSTEPVMRFIEQVMTPLRVM